MRFRKGFICMVAGLTLGFGGYSTWAGPSPVYRMSQLEEVKKRAAEEEKPIAWIGAFATNLTPYASKAIIVPLPKLPTSNESPCSPKEGGEMAIPQGEFIWWMLPPACGHFCAHGILR